MRTYVTSYQSKCCLSGFLKRAFQFYPVGLTIDIAPPGESKSDQLLRLFDNISEDEYVILLEDDFFFTQPVDLGLLSRIKSFCYSHQIDRFSLQCTSAYRGSCWDLYSQSGEHSVYTAGGGLPTLLAMDASIWNLGFMLGMLERGWSDADIEIKGSEKVRNCGYFKICALDHCVMNYQDAMRDGQRVVFEE